MPTPPESSARPATPFWQLFAIFILVGACVFLLDGAPGASFAADVDDIARKLQIMDLLRDGQWHDPTWPFLAMPEPYYSPWSRLVDAPYVLVTWALSPFTGTETAFGLSRLIVPVLWFGVYAVLAVRIMQRLTPYGLTALSVGIAALCAFLAIAEFHPGRIDHHNVQLVLMLALCLGLVSPHRHAGVLIGLASFLSVAIGLECTPFVAMAIVGLGLVAAWTGEADHVRRLTATGLTLSIITLPLSLMLIGSNAVGQVQCDALSAPWILALSTGGLVIALAPRLWRLDAFTHPAARLASLAVPGALLLALLWVAFPLCHHGPLYMIDPIAKEYWFSRIFQEHNILEHYAEGGLVPVIFAPVAFIGILLATWLWARPKTAGSMLVFVMAVAALGLTLLQGRNFRFAAALAPLFLPAVIQAYARVGSLRTRLIPVIAPLLVSVAIIGLIKRTETQLDPITFMEGDACIDADLSVLDAAPPGIIMAPSGLSFRLAEHTEASGRRHPVASLPFHRAAPSISKVAKTFILTDPDQRRAALAPFDYVAVCRIKVDLDRSVAPIYAALVAGENWPGLVDVESDTESRFRLLRIDHEALR